MGRPSNKVKQRVPVDADELVAARAEVTYYKQQYESVLVRIRALEKEIVHWRGRRLKIGGISKTLEQAKSDWIDSPAITQSPECRTLEGSSGLSDSALDAAIRSRMWQSTE
jgi:hypothetical protein